MIKQSMKFWITILISIFFVFGCKHSKKPFMQRIEECTCSKKIKDSVLYSIDNSRFDKGSILKLFNEGIIVDSSFSKRSDGGNVLAYTFRDDSSKFIVSLYNYSEGKYDCNIAFFEIKSNIIKFKNGIKINMARSDFFKTFQIKETDCDTFDIFRSEKFAGYYYRFAFKDDKLISIKTVYILE